MHIYNIINIYIYIYVYIIYIAVAPGAPAATSRNRCAILTRTTTDSETFTNQRATNMSPAYCCAGLPHALLPPDRRKHIYHDRMIQ